MNSYAFAFLAALGIGLVSMPFLIKLLHKLKFGQTIRPEGVEAHYSKAGTPTMGGMMFPLAVAFSFLITGQFDSRTLLILVLAASHSLLGFADDYIKAVKKNPDGLSAKTKLIFQFTFSMVFLVFLALNNHNTSLIFPFIEAIDFKIVYWIFALLYLVFFNNAVNILDGVDGLCTGQSIIALGFLSVVSYWQDDQQILTMALALMGALFAFFYFNRNPAKVFMGDTGSLSLGFFLAATALILKVEVIFLWAGFVFVADIFSVIIQVIYFKKTGGKRIFKKTPFHHHFEESGWSEWKVDFAFWAWGLFFALSGLLFYLKGWRL